MALQQIDGRAIWVVETAPDPQALALHCSLARHDILLPLVTELGVAARLCDLPDHGRSDAWDGRGDYQDALAQIILALCPPSGHVIAHSYAATAALRAAVLSPTVKRLSLIEPVFFAATRGTRAWDAHQAAFAPFAAALEAGDAMTAAGVFHAMFGEGKWDDLPAPVRASIARRIGIIPIGAPAIEDDVHGLWSSGALSGLDIPVTLIRGDRTDPVVPAIHDALCRVLPRATDHVVPGAGHMVPVTHPADVAAIIRAAG